jgi:hypothetical protein
MSPTVEDVAALAVLANGILPADERDAGAAAVDAGPRLALKLTGSPLAALYRRGLSVAATLARELFDRGTEALNPEQVSRLFDVLREREPAFVRQLRMDVCALYLSDPEVWARIGFPGPSADRGGYPDFDQQQF